MRVLVSRLFNTISRKLDSSCDYKNNQLYRSRRNELIQLFQKCYENIDYLKNKPSEELDDLEKLAGLGSSAELKNNLYNLVNLFLKMMTKKSSGDMSSIN